MPVPAVDPTAPPSLRKRVMTALGGTRAGSWFVQNVSPRVDPALVTLSRGRVSTIAFTPVALLTTTGARSGLPRTTPLLYFTDGDRVVLMASHYGRPTQPAWYHNLRATPVVTLRAGGHEGRYRWQEATGEERERLWGLARRLARTYAQYEETTDGREIPVLVLTPLAEGAAGAA